MHSIFQKPINEHVAWVEVMRAQVSMLRSIQSTANFVFKLPNALDMQVDFF